MTNLTDGVKSESSQNILQIQDGVSPGSILKQRDQTEVDFFFKRFNHKFPKGLSGEFVASQLPLGGPQLAVDIENAAPE